MLDQFEEVWSADFEFCAPPGERPRPICMVAREHRSQRELRLWRDELFDLPQSPFPPGPDSLFVAYYASAELGCFLALDWKMPERILDLFAEFRCLTNGAPTVAGNGLLGALAHYGIDGIDAVEKDSMRDLAMRGGEYTADERQSLLDYCASDVVALDKLVGVMANKIDLPRALLRGRSMAAVARMEWAGVPIDVEMLDRLQDIWERIKLRMISEVDADYGCYIPTGRGNLHPAIESAAAEWGLDPYDLADAVDYAWQAEKESTREFFEAKRAARKATGLTVKRINKLEDSLFDHTSLGGFDTQARTLAARYPELGIGSGYVTEDGVDGTDYAAKLWELLRDNRDKPPAKHDPDILRRAAELVERDGPEQYRQLSFSAARFGEWLARSGIPWPRLDSGFLDLRDETFRQMARRHPEVAPLRELRHSLSQLRLNQLSVGRDGRNRCLLSPFRARTGRNQPSNSQFIFGPSVWLRGLIKPGPHSAVAYIDWCQQEFGIAGVLSGDEAMVEAYVSGDPYLTFAKQAGAAPANATRETHGDVRNQFKICALAVQYGMAAQSLAVQIGQPEVYGRELLRKHRQTYPKFWEWSRAAVDHAMLRGWLQTVFGWRILTGTDANPRSLANFPVQANGAEMLRLACCLATERGIEVCAPIHDALLVHARINEIDDVVDATQAAMREASAAVLDGFELRSDVEIVRYPDRYSDARGRRMWEIVSEILVEVECVPF